MRSKRLGIWWRTKVPDILAWSSSTVQLCLAARGMMPSESSDELSRVCLVSHQCFGVLCSSLVSWAAVDN